MAIGIGKDAKPINVKYMIEQAINISDNSQAQKIAAMAKTIGVTGLINSSARPEGDTPSLHALKAKNAIVRLKRA